jgi:hypothetical protein
VGRLRKKLREPDKGKASEWLIVTVSRRLGGEATSKRFEARAASLGVGIVREKLVSS